MNGDWPLPTKLPLVGGHEGAGHVVAKGDLVKDIEIGDPVGIKWINGSCLACDFCQQADEPVSLFWPCHVPFADLTTSSAHTLSSPATP